MGLLRFNSRNELARWVETFEPSPYHVIVTGVGDEGISNSEDARRFAKELRSL